MKYKSIFLIFLIFSVKFSYGQKNFKIAEKMFQEGHFFSAIEYYKKSYEDAKKEEQKTLIIYRTAECYRLIDDYKQAEQWYIKAIKANYTDPIVRLYLADAKKSQGKYNEAFVEFTYYKRAVPSDPRGEDGARSCELAIKWHDSPTNYKVENMSLINRIESDFSPSYADNKYIKLYFISKRPGEIGAAMDPAKGEHYSDIFETQMDKNGKWSFPVPLPSPVNTKDNEGVCVVSKKGDMLFFTRYVDQINSQLWVADKKGDVFGEPIKLNFCTDNSKFKSPCISTDGMTLLFSSNMPGGQGDNDIWMSKYDKGNKKWGTPTNLGPGINTPGNDIYPYIHDDGTLYFSSTGHLGMGGLDIYKAEKKGEDQWINVTNMKYPINSEGDDFGIIFEGKKERGYLSSNRLGTKGGLDIWFFEEVLLKEEVPSFKSTNSSSIIDKEIKIKMVYTSGVFKIPVKINDLGEIDFIFDTGASETTVTADVVSTMIRQKMITEEDFLPGATYVLADGREVKSPRFTIKKLQIGNIVLKDISAVITNATADPLLGQNVLGQFKSIKQQKDGYLIIEK